MKMIHTILIGVLTFYGQSIVATQALHDVQVQAAQREQLTQMSVLQRKQLRDQNAEEARKVAVAKKQKEEEVKRAIDSASKEVSAEKKADLGKQWMLIASKAFWKLGAKPDEELARQMLAILPVLPANQKFDKDTLETIKDFEEWIRQPPLTNKSVAIEYDEKAGNKEVEDAFKQWKAKYPALSGVNKVIVLARQVELVFKREIPQELKKQYFKRLLGEYFQIASGDQMVAAELNHLMGNLSNASGVAWKDPNL